MTRVRRLAKKPIFLYVPDKTGYSSLLLNQKQKHKPLDKTKD
jgi:hypothetical protein